MSARIVFGTVRERELPEEVVPHELLGQNNLLLDQWRKDGMLVFCQNAAYMAMQTHAEADKRKECTGLLAGQAFKDPERQLPFAIITDAIPISTPDRSAVHVSVTNEQFETSIQHLQQKTPGISVIGWYHTHPNLGIFLSGTDLRVTQGLFNASWHVAAVIDPVRREEGVFVQQGQQRISPLVRTDRQTPIVQFMSLYRHASELIEAGEMATALKKLKQLDDYFHNEQTYRTDLRLWKDRNEYRDTARLISAATYGSPHQDVDSSANIAAVATSDATMLGLIGDIRQSQRMVIQQMQQTSEKLGQRREPDRSWRDIIAILLLGVIGILLTADIYVQQKRNMLMGEQNTLLQAIVAEDQVTPTRQATQVPAILTPTIQLAPTATAMLSPTVAFQSTPSISPTLSP